MGKLAAWHETNEFRATPMRQRAFYRLAALQDAGLSVVRSRELVAAEFQLALDYVRQIEEEGIRRDWPIPEGGE